MQTGIIIQARLGSTRLKNKMVIPFYDDQSILQILLSKLKNTIPIVLATTVAPQDEAVEAIAEDFNIPCYRGSEENVLARFIMAAEIHKFDRIIRICADNPFLDIDLINALITASETNQGADYISFWTENKTPVIKTHFGFFAEMVSLSALKKVAEQTKDNLFLEHVTNYIYTYPDMFKLKWLELPDYLKSRKDIRLTIDTRSDFENGQTILSESNKTIENLKTQEIIEIIDSDKALKISMTKEIEKNSK